MPTMKSNPEWLRAAFKSPATRVDREANVLRGMVVAQLGLAMSIVSEAVFGVVVFMSVATTVLAPPLLAVVYRGVPSRKVEPTQTRIG